MSEDLYEQLSRLLDGELSTTAEAALRARIAADPEVSAAWSAVQRLSGDLDVLPPSHSPPASLDARVLSAVSRPPRAGHRGWLSGAALAAAAAAALLFLWTPPSAPSVTMSSGRQLVHGELLVLASSVPVSVSGRAEIFVEPPGGWSREPGQEDEEMVKTVLSAGAGILVTVAVYEGRAVLSPPDGEPITVEAGEQRSVAVPSSTPPASEPRAREVARQPAPAGGVISPELASYVESLESELALLRMERDMQRGALRALEGTEQEWPTDVPEAYQPEAFEASMASIASSDSELEFVGVDCEEFPCLAMFRSHSESDDWMPAVARAVEEDWGSREGDVSMSAWVSQSRDGEESVNLAGISLMPPGEKTDEVETRSEWRMDGWLKDTTEELRSGE